MQSEEFQNHDIFRFQRFQVCHHGSAMKVGTDGLLLGLLAPANGTNVLDIGTGSGLVALILAQRMANAQICGIDIDATAARQADENFAASPWSNRLKSIHADAVTFHSTKKFDLIVCNPPYYQNSPRTSSHERDVARIADCLPHRQLIGAVNHLLTESGLFSVIIPSSISESFQREAWETNLFLIRRIQIYTKVGKPCKRQIQIFSRHESPIIDSSFTILDHEGQRSTEYQELVKDFLIK